MFMFSKRIVVTSVLLCALAVPASAQAPVQSPPPATPPVAATEQAAVPTVSEVDALKWAIAIKDLENAQLRLEKAQTTAQAVFRSLQRPGYTLDLETMTYKKAAEPTPPVPAPTPAPKPGGGGLR